MGVSTESPVIRLRNRDGIALVAAIFGIVIVSLITAGAFALTDLDTKATYNREDAARALRLVHTAQAHSLSLFRTVLADTTIDRLLRGSDDTPGTADDGLFIDHPGFDNTIDIPAAGRATADGTYFARILDDPHDGDADPFNDTNWRFVVRCAAETTRGSRSAIEFVVKYLPPLPAVAMNGSTIVQGQAAASGACGDIHMNGNVSVSGTITVNNQFTSTGTATMGGGAKVQDAGGTLVGVYPVPEPIPIPMMTSAEYCPGARYVLQADGVVLDRATGLPTVASLLGWTWSLSSGLVIWTSNSSLVTGSYCVEGNASLTGNPGSVLTPVPVSIYAAGSVDVAGNPNISAFDSNDIVVLADGDLYVRGNSNTNYEGILYGGSNCQVSGSPNLSGQFLCQSGPLPAGATDPVAFNLIEGQPQFVYSCTWANFNDKYKIVSWYQRVGG